MPENRIIKVKYSSNGYTKTRAAYQYDYGQVLRLEGFPEGMLPDPFEVHFSVGNGLAKTQIGTDSAVSVLDECLERYGTIAAWLFLHDTASDGETKYTIEIPVRSRSKPVDAPPTPVQQSAITQAIAALGRGVDAAEAAQATAEAAADSVRNAGATAETLTPGSAATVEVRDINGAKVFCFGIPEGLKGDTGVSITGAVLNPDYTLTISFSNNTSYTTPSIRGETGATGETGPTGATGATGATPAFSIGTVSTLQPGQSATASITGTPAAPVLNLGIPQGAPGNATIDDTAGEGDTTKVWSADKNDKENKSLKSAITSYEEAVVLVKNLSDELTLGKYASSDTYEAGGNIRFYDSDTRGYAKIKVKPNTKYAINLNANDGFSANFSWWAYESSWPNGTAISKVTIDNNCITTSPANANLLYITVNNPASATVLVVLEQDLPIHGATASEYPYNVIKAVVIDTLRLDKTKYELHNVDVSTIYDSELSFTWDANNNALVISSNWAGNNLFIVTSNEGKKTLTLTELGTKSWSIPHNGYLVYLYNSDTFVIKTAVDDLTVPYIILAHVTDNGQGTGGNLQVSGNWEKYWIKQGLSNRIGILEGEINDILDDLPAYYYANNYFPNKLQDVRDKMNFQNGLSFAFITDTHFQENSRNSSKMLAQILRETQVPFVVFGGDAPRLFADADRLASDLASDLTVLQSYISRIGRDNWYAIRGNHDFYTRTDAPVETRVYYAKTEGEVYNLLMKSSEQRMSNGDPSHMCYYVDIPAQKTRLIMLNTTDPQTSPILGGGSVSEAQAQWLAETILSVEDTHVVVFSHIPLEINLAGEEAIKVRYLRWILKAFKNKTAVEAEIGGQSYSFANTTNDLVCVISGHNHKDQWGTESAFLNIVTMCDARYNYDGYPQATNGTITEQAFDVFFVDFDNKTIKTVRFGRGSNRAWNYSNGTVIT